MAATPRENGGEGGREGEKKGRRGRSVEGHREGCVYKRVGARGGRGG